MLRVDLEDDLGVILLPAASIYTFQGEDEVKAGHYRNCLTVHLCIYVSAGSIPTWDFALCNLL
jgi:hypothetical protein